MSKSLRQISSLIIMSNITSTGRNVRAKRWVFTLNNYTEEDINKLQNPPSIIKTDIQYLIYGEEIAPTTRTPHLQGYFRMENKFYRTALIRMFPPLEKAFVEQARGTEYDNIKYCKKEGKYYEEGTPIAAAQKSSIADQYIQIINDIKNGAKWDEIETKYPVILMNKINAIDKLLERHQTKQMEKTWDGDLKEKNIWIWGPSGVGKSKWAWTQGNLINSYPKMQNKWWDGFDPTQHKYVLIEDWQPVPGNMLLSNIKQWGDRYPFTGEKKGRSLIINPGGYKLIITANQCIKDSFPNIDEVNLEAIQRRFTELEIKSQNDLNLIRKW